MRQNVFTIAPHAPFLRTLAAAVVDERLLPDWPREGPFWLADVTILLPTRRARLALAHEFLALGHGLLPDIRSIGSEDGEEEPFLPPIDLPPPLPAVAAGERRLVLAQLIDQWSRQPGGRAGFANPPSAAESFRLADSLAGLLDDLAIERVQPAALRAVAPENLAENWQQTLSFLDIVLEAWPKIIMARGQAEIVVLRNERLERQAASAALRYGERPLIAAGSTGSQPATADLLAAIARLPRGVVVLPGLDTGLAANDAAALADASRAPHAHPQYGLVRLLQGLGLGPDAVTELAPEPAAPRTLVLRRALALADATAGWVSDRTALAPMLATALDGLAVLAAPGEDLEARAIAVAARAALAEGKNVGIVSPDRNLARRIAAELMRFDIEVDDAAGTPLFQSAAGRLARLLLTLAAESFAPVPLMALLRNRAVTLGLPRSEIGHLADLVELGLLRGQRPAIGLAGLRRALAANVEERTRHVPRRLSAEMGLAVSALLDRLQVALDPLCRMIETPVLAAPQLAAALLPAFTAVIAAPAGEATALLAGQAEFVAWAEALAGSNDAGHGFAPQGLDAVLAALMSGSVVRAARPGRTDIAIWGQLEARLQHADLMILAGLNEGVWPAPADPGPWLSRGMRLAAGLEPPERRQGQAAHDFEMAAGGPDVILAFSTRRGSSPALPSPLLQRLEAFVGKDFATALRTKGAVWLEQARRIDLVPTAMPAPRPAPRPAAELRPRKLSVTEIETLFRSPYDIYARHVLKLRPLDPLGEEPGARERGSMIHEVFARFVNEGGDPTAADAQQRLEAMARQAFAGLEAISDRRDIWLRRFSRAAELFLAFESGRQKRIVKRYAEIDGLWLLPSGFTLSGRADRLDVVAGGGLEIIDFKTGGVPAPKDMKAFEAPQLLLEAAMAAAGAFPGLPPLTTQSLTYVKIGLGPDAFVQKPFALRDGFGLAEAIEEASRRMQSHVAEFLLSDRLAMPPRIRPAVTTYRGTYEHLARTDEWALAAALESDI